MAVAGEDDGDVPVEQDAFCEYVCRVYLELADVPKDELARLYRQASEDLRSLRSNIATCTTEIQAIDSRAKTGARAEDGYRKRWLDYVMQKNQEAMDEIVVFLADGVEGLALCRSQRGLFSRAFVFLQGLESPYPYRWNPRSYNADSLSDIRNKLSEVLVRDLPEWERLYRDDSEAFAAKLSAYIHDNGVDQVVLDLIGQSHHLAARREILEQGISAWRGGQPRLFATAAVLQIEGIFSDVCEAVGAPPRFRGMVDKVELLQQRLDFLSAYEYYAFRFPAWRNQIAHGGFPNRAPDLIADLLLLDLREACAMVLSDVLPLNRVVELRKAVAGKKPEPRDLALLALSLDVEVPEFYGLEPLEMELAPHWVADEFWGLLDSLIEHGDEVTGAAVRDLAIRLKRRRVAETKAKAILQKTARLSRRGGTLVDYWDAISGTYIPDAESHHPA